MDPVSFASGVAGVVSTFTACLDAFDILHVGRRLGPDYETSVIKLDVVRLRFTRWGEAVGITQNDESAAIEQLKSQLDSPDKDFDTVKRTLGQILVLFERSEETSKRLKLKAPNVEEGGDDIENATIRNLHEAMRRLALKRQKRSMLSQKISWALYRKRDFNDLIEGLTELVSALVELAPAKLQQEICTRELAEMDTDQNLVLLDDVLRERIGDDGAEMDSTLQECVTEVIKQKRGAVSTATWKRNKVGDGSRIQQGDNIASDYQGEVSDRKSKYIVEESEFGSNVVFQQGHNYGRTT